MCRIIKRKARIEIKRQIFSPPKSSELNKKESLKKSSFPFAKRMARLSSIDKAMGYFKDLAIAIKPMAAIAIKKTVRIKVKLNSSLVPNSVPQPTIAHNSVKW